jgi:hypothetical protein
LERDVANEGEDAVVDASEDPPPPPPPPESPVKADASSLATEYAAHRILLLR